MLTYFRQILIVALLAGMAAGVFSWGLHMVGSTPLILKAEIFERQADAEAPASASENEPSHDHAGAYVPEDGWERNLLTLGADLVTGVGFAMALVAGLFFLGGPVDYRRGLLWGLIGFIAFSLAPAIGLPPTLPGTPEGPLLDRQIWWVLTVAATLLGIFMMFKGRKVLYGIAGLGLIALPHIIGAPMPPMEQPATPELLRLTFLWVTLGSTFLFWLSLGGMTGALYGRFVDRAGK